MTIHDIENLTAAELKERREEILQALAAEPVEVLAARYFQARFDARQRDEKLGEQGQTIQSLNESLALVQQQREIAENSLQSTQEQLQKLSSQSQQRQAEADDRQAAMTSEVTAAISRAARLKEQAIRYHKAVHQSAGLLNDAISAQAIDDAEQG